MMTATEAKKTDRPAPRKRVQPAQDEHKDPVAIEQPVKVRTRRKETTVQLAVRVSEDLAERVALRALTEGITQRQVIEDLIRTLPA